jgi:hypothetical protein
MKRKTIIGALRGWLPKSPSCPTQNANMLSTASYAAKIALALRLVYGMALIALLFTPFAFYFSRVEPYFMGYIWGYQLTTGYIGLVLGMLVILAPKTIGRKLNFGTIMMIIGICLFASSYFTSYDYFVNVIHGTNLAGGAIDVEYPMGHIVTVYLALFSIIAGIVTRISVSILRKPQNKA